MFAPPVFIFGLHLGQVSDPTALAGLQQTHGPDPAKPTRTVTHYKVLHLQRWPLGTSYPDIVANVMALLNKPAVGGCRLAVDQTGVGRPVVDMFRHAIQQARIPVELRPINITGGAGVTHGPTGLGVAKKKLASTLQALLQQKRIKFAKLPETAELVKELRTFTVKINTSTAAESYESWREGQKDDLVLATMLATWLGEHSGPSTPPRTLIPGAPSIGPGGTLVGPGGTLPPGGYSLGCGYFPTGPSGLRPLPRLPHGFRPV
jgi:hypothetical protein